MKSFERIGTNMSNFKVVKVTPKMTNPTPVFSTYKLQEKSLYTYLKIRLMTKRSDFVLTRQFCIGVSVCLFVTR